MVYSQVDSPLVSPSQDNPGAGGSVVMVSGVLYSLRHSIEPAKEKILYRLAIFDTFSYTVCQHLYIVRYHLICYFICPAESWTMLSAIFFIKYKEILYPPNKNTLFYVKITFFTLYNVLP